MWPYDMNQGYPQMGGYPQYQPQAPTGAAQGDARIDKLKGRVGRLQEQWKGADTEQQAAITGRMDQMNSRIKGLRADRRQGEGLYGQPAGQQGGAQPEPAMMQGSPRMPGAMDWMRNQNMGMGGGMYGQMGNQMGGASQYGGGFPQGFGQMQDGFGMNPMQYGGMQGGGMYGGGMGGMGGMPWGAPNMGQYRAQMEPAMYNPSANQGGAPPQGANRPGMQYRQDRRQARQGGAQPEPGQMPNPGAQPVAPQQGGWNPLTTPTAMGGNSFNSPFGDLVLGSTGNNNVFQQNGGSGNDLYHYDPNQGWKHMTADEYKSYGDFNYADPRQFGAGAGQKMQEWENRGGFLQGKVGTGAYA